MSRQVGSRCAIAAIVLLFSAIADAATWKSFRSEDGKFTVDGPEISTLSTTYQKTPVGIITNHRFTAWDGSGKFRLDFSELPRFAVKLAGANTIYDRAKGQFLTQTLSRQISYRDATVDGHAGKLLIYNTPSAPRRPETHGQAYFVLVGTRLYVISAVVSDGDPESKAKRFLSSVRLD